MQQNHTCQKLCSVSIPPEDSKFINDRIQEDYALNWLVDGLPAAEMKEVRKQCRCSVNRCLSMNQDVQTGELFFDMGFDLGKDEGEFAQHPALNNHYEIVLKFATYDCTLDCS
jgi:transmembrane 9 superfamily protein 2/4